MSKHASKYATAAFIEYAVRYKGDDCLLWPFGKTHGYGRIGRGYIHRVVCEVVYGPAPEGKYEAAHNCGISICVNPRHLRWDTPKGNQADQIRHFGGQHSNAVLTVSQVQEIRNHPERRAIDFAREYGVTPGTIHHIRRKRNWAWV